MADLIIRREGATGFIVFSNPSKRNALTYLTYSDRVIEGSPDNAVTAVAVLDQKIPLK